MLFVHGAGTPAEVAFDVPYQDYSWMAYLAQAGLRRLRHGHDRLRPLDAAGGDERPVQPREGSASCRLPRRPCAPSYPHQLTTIQSDWDDIGAVVDYVRALRHVDKVSLIGVVARRTARRRLRRRSTRRRCSKLVLLAPAYNRNTPAGRAGADRPTSAAFNTQSRDEFDANWDRQVGCADQYDRATSDSVWSAMLASDPVGATWGPGVRRAPQTRGLGLERGARSARR